MSLLFVIYSVWCTCKLRPSVSLKQYIKIIQKEYIFSLTIHSVFFLSVTKSFRPFWDGRKLTQKCRYRWLCALKSDKSQKANVAVFAQKPVNKSLYNIIDLCYSHIYLLGSRNARKRELISIGGTIMVIYLGAKTFN